MKVPVSWLREYVDFDVAGRASSPRSSSSRAARSTGSSSRGVVDVDGNLGRFLVGHVVEAGKHPNADRLQLCRVDVGEGEPRQIVCGAWNFGAGATVAVALPGALLPGADAAARRGEAPRRDLARDDPLRARARARRRPQRDHGARGWARARDAARGRAAADGGRVLEIETGFNRPDLTSVYGIAREVSALTGAELAPPPGRDPERAGDEPVDIRVEDFEGCPRYIGRIFRGAQVGPSPAWLKARLLAAGMRSISNVVDITNYVMLALGSPAARVRPLDCSRRAGSSSVARSRGRRSGRSTATSASSRPPTSSSPTRKRPVAVAGIMGGEDSEVRDETTDILLEAANFDALTVLRTSGGSRLRSDASHAVGEGRRPVRGRAGGGLRDRAARLRRRRELDRAWPTSTATLPRPPVVRPSAGARRAPVRDWRFPSRSRSTGCSGSASRSRATR